MARFGLKEGLCVAFLHSLIASCAVGNICCTYDQFEANLYFDNANVFIDLDRLSLGTSYGYFNSTTHVAYDYTNNRTYLNVSSVQVSPLTPQPIYERYEIINDYRKGIQYLFYGLSCEKISIGALNSQCIPDNAILMSTGYIGNNQTYVETYMFNQPGNPIWYTASINPRNCLPAYVTYSTTDSMPDSGSVDGFLVFNITAGISNPDVFNPPASCSSTTEVNQFKVSESHGYKSAKRFNMFFHYSK